MTPQDALAMACEVAANDDSQSVEEAILAALAADGWTVARTQDARDGEALALLVAAVPQGWSWGVFLDRAAGAIRAWAEDPYRHDEQPHHISEAAPTIAAAADACREAIEATR